MKTPRLFALFLVAFFALLTPRPADARVETSFDFFYDSLSPYGEWVQVADYGFCWRPTEVDEDWAPYSDGYWAFTDAGWTWVSYEDFGGIVYHYGRWVRVEDEGWCWVPDYEWGPAWVSWRNSDDYVGWAPLPPEARWQPSIGISTWVDRDCDIGPAYYSFCRVRDFGAPVLRPVIINRIENVTIIRRTVNITNITYNTHYGSGPIIYNGGPSFTFINERSSRRVPALKLVQNTNIDLSGMRDGNRGDRRRNFNGQAVGNQLVVTAPYVKPPTDPGFLRPQVKKVIAADRVTRGWGMVKNDEVRRELKQEMQRQTKGLTRDTAPARAVAVNDLKVLPEKADPQATSPVAGRDGRDRDGRDNRDGRGPDRKGNPQTTVTGQPPTATPGANGTLKPTVDTNRTPSATDEKKGRDQGRSSGMRDPRSPVAGDPNLKPFNPANDPDSRTGRDRGPGVPATPGTVPPDSARDPRTARPGDDGSRRRGSDEEAGRMKERGDQEKAGKQAEAAAAAQQQQQKQQMDAQRQAEAQRQADAVRQQKEAAAAAGRQRMQAEQNAARQQADQQAVEQQRRQAVEQERRMQRDRGNADEQGQRAQDAEREQKRRQQMDAGAAQQRQAEALRRQAMEQQQRGQRDAAEQARRAQEGQQRQQAEAQRQQGEAQRQQMQQQRQQRQQQQQQQQAPQVAPPSTAPAESDNGGRRKKKD